MMTSTMHLTLVMTMSTKNIIKLISKHSKFLWLSRAAPCLKTEPWQIGKPTIVLGKKCFWWLDSDFKWYLNLIDKVKVNIFPFKTNNQAIKLAVNSYEKSLEGSLLNTNYERKLLKMQVTQYTTFWQRTENGQSRYWNRCWYQHRFNWEPVKHQLKSTTTC